MAILALLLARRQQPTASKMCSADSGRAQRCLSASKRSNIGRDLPAAAARARTPRVPLLQQTPQRAPRHARAAPPARAPCKHNRTQAGAWSGRSGAARKRPAVALLLTRPRASPLRCRRRLPRSAPRCWPAAPPWPRRAAAPWRTPPAAAVCCQARRRLRRRRGPGAAAHRPSGTQGNKAKGSAPPPTSRISSFARPPPSRTGRCRMLGRCGA